MAGLPSGLAVCVSRSRPDRASCRQGSRGVAAAIRRDRKIARIEGTAPASTWRRHAHTTSGISGKATAARRKRCRPGPFAVHADLDVMRMQNIRKYLACELRALIRVADVGLAVLASASSNVSIQNDASIVIATRHDRTCRITSPARRPDRQSPSPSQCTRCPSPTPGSAA